MPDVGLLPVRDSETGMIVYVDTSLRSVREDYGGMGQEGLCETLLVLRKYKVDTVSIRTDQDYVKSLVALFKTRA